jgi:purine nucleosidase
MFRTVFLLAMILFNGCLLTVKAQPRKVIIDCDPGIDDATAIILALQASRFDIVGITTVFGNASLEQGTKNALRVVELSGKSIPVFKGAVKPLSVQPEPTISAEEKPAVEFLVDMARQYPHQITILAVGRLTNLAEALKLDSNFVRNVKEVILMGGSLHAPGNVSPVAEANVSGDPHAADIVFTASWRVTMIGLDVTQKVKLNDGILMRIRDKNSRYGPFLYSITRFYMNFHKNVNHIEGGFYVHDPSAVMYLIDSTIFKMKRGPVRVVTEGIAIGQTIMPAYDYQLELPAWKDKPFVSTAVDVDVSRFLQKFESIMLQKQL